MKGERSEVFDIDPTALDKYLSDFFISVQKKDGSEYEPTTLRCYLASFDLFLQENHCEKSLIKDAEFTRTRSALKSKQKDLKRQGKGNKPNAANELSKEEVQQLFDKKLLGPFPLNP